MTRLFAPKPTTPLFALALPLALPLVLAACGDTQQLVRDALVDTEPVVAVPVAEPEAPPSPFEARAYSELAPVEGLEGTVLYRANVRQMSADGTLGGVTAQLDRLEALGVGVVSLTPVFPVGEEGRAGELGRVEAVADHTRVGGEFGTREDLRALVEAAHARGMRVVLGWPADTVARDHPWAERGWLREAGWTEQEPDVLAPDWSAVELREAVADAMRGWLELGVDGFHVTGVEQSPVDFWEQVRAELAPALMVADTDELAYARAGFHALTDTRMREAVQAVVQGEADARDVRQALGARDAWPREVIRLVPTSDMEQNRRRGTPNQLYGFAYQPALVLSWLGGGVPTVYSGQEAGSRNRLDATARDPIVFRDHPVGALMGRLTQLRDERAEVFADARARPFSTTEPRRVVALSRGNAGERVVMLLNFSEARVRFSVEGVQGIFADSESGTTDALVPGQTRNLPGWGWQVLVESREEVLEEEAPPQEEALEEALGDSPEPEPEGAMPAPEPDTP